MASNIANLWLCNTLLWYIVTWDMHLKGCCGHVSDSIRVSSNVSLESTCSDCSHYFDGNMLCGNYQSIYGWSAWICNRKPTLKFVMACFYRVFLHVRISTIKMLGFTLYYIFMNNSINLCHNKKPWCTHICEPQKISPYETEMCDRLWIMHCDNFCWDKISICLGSTLK